jgi:predicted DNA-binding protein (MmcQ/YjbR family)
MNIEDFRNYCLSKNGVTEGFPFDKNTLVFKVSNKMFALTNVDQFNSINLKCDPSYSVELREQYEGIKPGYHMNKRHWNTVLTHSDVPYPLITRLIDMSYELVYKRLTKKQKKELN